MPSFFSDKSNCVSSTMEKVVPLKERLVQLRDASLWRSGKNPVETLSFALTFPPPLPTLSMRWSRNSFTSQQCTKPWRLMRMSCNYLLLVRIYQLFLLQRFLARTWQNLNSRSVVFDFPARSWLSSNVWNNNFWQCYTHTFADWWKTIKDLLPQNQFLYFQPLPVKHKILLFHYCFQWIITLFDLTVWTKVMTREP